MKESRSAKPHKKDLTLFHEEQRAKKSNEVEHCLLPVSNTSQSIDKSVPEVKTLGNNLTTVKDKTTRKSKRTVATVIYTSVDPGYCCGRTCLHTCFTVYTQHQCTCKE